MPDQPMELRPLTDAIRRRLDANAQWINWKNKYSKWKATEGVASATGLSARFLWDLFGGKKATVHKEALIALAKFLNCSLCDIAIVPATFSPVRPLSAQEFLHARISRLLDSELRAFEWWTAEAHNQTLKGFVEESAQRKVLRRSDVHIFDLPLYVSDRHSPLLNGSRIDALQIELRSELAAREWRIASPTTFVGAAALVFGLRAAFKDVSFKCDFSASQAVEFTHRITKRQQLRGGLPPDVIIGANGLLLQTLNRQVASECEYRVLCGCHPLSLYVAQAGEGLPDINLLAVEHGVLALDTTSPNTQNLWWEARADFWRRWKSTQMHPSQLIQRIAHLRSQGQVVKQGVELSMAYMLHSEFVEFTGLGSCIPLPKGGSRVSSRPEGFVVCQKRLHQDNGGRAAKALFAAIQSVVRELMEPLSELRDKVVSQMTSNSEYVSAIEDTLGIPAFNRSIQPRQ